MEPMPDTLNHITMVGNCYIFIQRINLCNILQSLDSAGNCVAIVKQGSMQGSTMNSGKGKPFCAFRGIPYSQLPVGQFRFKVGIEINFSLSILNTLIPNFTKYVNILKCETK